MLLFECLHKLYSLEFYVTEKSIIRACFRDNLITPGVEEVRPEFDSNGLTQI